MRMLSQKHEKVTQSKDLPALIFLPNDCFIKSVQILVQASKNSALKQNWKHINSERLDYIFIAAHQGGKYGILIQRRKYEGRMFFLKLSY